MHHLAAHEWFARNQSSDWRTCPITENGFLRVVSPPAYPNGPVSTSDLAERLEELKNGSPQYGFWPDDFSSSEWLCAADGAMASSQLTNAYLLKLAADREGALATFDLRITLALIHAREPAILEYIPV